MNISGILVVASVQRYGEVIASLSTLPGIDIHQTDEVSGRIVITQEATDIHGEIAGLRHIKTLPHVIMAEMVYHYFGEDQVDYPTVPAELAESDESSCTPEAACAVPAYLNS